jgi:hypothetical protein
MSRLFAEIVDAEVARVIVCDDPAWLVSRLGGQSRPFIAERG